MLLGTSGGPRHQEAMLEQPIFINGKMFYNTVSFTGVILRVIPRHHENNITIQMYING